MAQQGNEGVSHAPYWQGTSIAFPKSDQNQTCSPLRSQRVSRRTAPRSCGLPARFWSSSTTSGKPATAATSYESSMLELKTMNKPTTAVEEVTTLPELIAA